MAGIVISSTVGQETLATFCCCNGGESSNLIDVEWVSVEDVMDIVRSNGIVVRQLWSFQLAAPEISEVSKNYLNLLTSIHYIRYVAHKVST